MIQANDLRIGNYLTYHGDTDMPCKIDAQDIYNIELNYMHNAEIHSPIHITEEILLKCGFVERKLAVDIHFWRIFIWGEVEFCVNPLKKIWYIASIGQNIARKDLQYLHQLQNLYFALTNTELNITL